jgi:hypothetical protein
MRWDLSRVTVKRCTARQRQTKQSKAKRIAEAEAEAESESEPQGGFNNLGGISARLMLNAEC